jgi:hypothetical protein
MAAPDARARATAAKDAVKPLPLALLDDPLEYILADHLRQRCVCASLKTFATAKRASRAEADQVIAFLSCELPLHHQDEDLDLFPTLRRRLHPEDDLGAVLARLSEDHKRTELLIHDIIDALAAHPADDPVKVGRHARETMLGYSALEHRHLVIENGIVLVIARRRLTAADLKAMSGAMKARRGVH